MRLNTFATLTVLLAASLAARAESFDFTFGNSSDSFSGYGVLTTGTMVAPGEYLINGVSGTVETVANGPYQAISAILTPGSFPTISNGGTFPANDNTLFVNNGIGNLSQDGLSFILNNGAQINLYDDGPGDDALLDRANGAEVNENVPLAISAVASTPEPSSFALLGTGLLGVVGLLKRRFALDQTISGRI